MTEVEEKKEETTQTEEQTPAPEAASADTAAKAENGEQKTEDKEPKRTPQKREFKKNRRPARRQAPRSEFDQRILSIRRVTRVSAGGRRFSFSVAMAIGNGKGKVGVGTGKATDTALAIEKAVKNAKKNMVEVKVTNTMSIPHAVEAKYSSAVVKIQPSPGRGVVAGSAIRDLIELGGLRDIVGKIISGSKNKLNIANATLKALDTLNAPKGHQAPKKNPASPKASQGKVADKKPAKK